MTQQQWLRLGSRIARIWPHQPIPDETLVEWFRLVSDLEVEQVDAAITVLAMDGREFPPHGGVIRQRVVELSEEPVLWGEVWREIQRAISRYGSYTPVEDIPWSSPRVSELVRQVGWQELCWTTDPETVVEAQCREKWSGLGRRNREAATYHGVPNAGLKRLGDLMAPKAVGDGESSS